MTRINLKRTKPLMWRGVELPPGCTLESLLRVIQGSMGWNDCHLYEFHILDERY